MKKLMLLLTLAGLVLAGCAQPNISQPPEQSAQEPASSLESIEPVRFLVETAQAENGVHEITGDPPELVYNLPADELPREAVELYGSVRQDYWRDTLIPLAWDEEADVTLYGVVSGIPETMGMLVGPDIRALESYGIVLRQGERAEYFPLYWGGNMFMGSNPWLLVDDLDGDGLDEAAVCLHDAAGGTGMSTQSLYIFDLDTFDWSKPDISALEIRADYAPEARTVLLTNEEQSLELVLEDYMTPEKYGINIGGQIAYSCEEGQIMYDAALDFGFTAYGCNVIGPIVWNGNSYAWGPVSEMKAL